MENLLIQATKSSPEVNLNAQTGIMSIVGKSFPENTFEYYNPIIKWLKEYLKETKNQQVIFNLDLEYLNSSSLKAYFDLFDTLNNIDNTSLDIVINWIFDSENDIAEETGEDFMADFETLNIKLIPKD